jgi:DNA-binding NarL/FixJ family response regulator
MMLKIRVIVLDDHHLFRRGIYSVLADSSDIEIVGEGGSGQELELLVKTLTPDVILLDLGMPQVAGGSVRTPGNTFRAFATISWITQTFPSTRILVISQYIDQAIVEGAAEAGVMGYILKDDELSRFLADAIRTIYRGGIYFSKAVSQALFRQSERKTLPKPFELTSRHIEILRAIITRPNLTYAEHASRLGIAENTLRNHIKTIFDRLQVNNLTAAVIKAIQLRIVDASILNEHGAKKP